MAVRCKHCNKPITFDGIVWIDNTEGDVCGWNGGNEPHEPKGKKNEKRN